MWRSLYSGFTLLELIVVVIVIGVLATLAIPQFSTSRERSLGYEAQANLKLIAAAQKVYRLEAGFYFPCTGPGVGCTGGIEDDIADINSNLKLSTNENNWNYGISGASAGSFSATAVRLGCTYTVTQNGADPAPSESCP